MLAQHQIMYRGEVVAGEILFVMGNTEMRTHHIHVVKWKDTLWNQYINFRDYLNAFPERLNYMTLVNKIWQSSSRITEKTILAARKKRYSAYWQRLAHGKPIC